MLNRSEHIWPNVTTVVPTAGHRPDYDGAYYLEMCLMGINCWKNIINQTIEKRYFKIIIIFSGWEGGAQQCVMFVCSPRVCVCSLRVFWPLPQSKDMMQVNWLIGDFKLPIDVDMNVDCRWLFGCLSLCVSLPPTHCQLGSAPAPPRLWKTDGWMEYYCSRVGFNNGKTNQLLYPLKATHS